MGQGPRTGRGLGYCSGSDTPGFTQGAGYVTGRGFGFGKGMRFGRGMGGSRGFGRGRGILAFNAGPIPDYPWMHPLSKEDEIKLLKSQAESLTLSQKEIEERLKELEKEKE
jgi:hypothetical protein